MPLLKDIVLMQTGIYMKPDRFGNAVYIQVKDFNEKGQLSVQLKPSILTSKRLEHHLLQEGDVLFAAKGDYNFAVVYQQEYPCAAASSSFFVLRHSSVLLPEYIAWFINHPETQRKLKAEAKGSSIASISMKTLGNLEIKILDLTVQYNVLRLDELRKKEKDIQSQIMQLKDKLIDTEIFKKI